MSKPKTAPAGTRTRYGKHGKVVENQDFTDLMRVMGVEPMNRKQRREQKRYDAHRSAAAVADSFDSNQPSRSQPL